LKFLKPVQIYRRVWFRAYSPKPDFSSPPALRERKGQWTAPIAPKMRLVSQWRFRFLNEEHDLGSDWNDPAWPRLWRYNLHYFADLNSKEADQRTDIYRDLIHKWITENPAPIGAGWEPYPLSLRIVNWFKWILAGNTPEPKMVASLATQIRQLFRTVDYHLLGNHLFENAKALVYAGLCFEGPEARRWLDKGLAILKVELAEQVLKDGGHFERSPMYHALVLEGLLDLINIAGAFPDVLSPDEQAAVKMWRDRAGAMLEWLDAMTHPDGEIVLFNDAALGTAPQPAQLAAFADRLGIVRTRPQPQPVLHLRDTGYFRLQAGSAAAFLDAAPLGPDYLPAHGHADTLTFELSLHGHRVLVDTGTSCYQEGAERLLQRSTAAHNTLCIDGENSSEIWGAFRVARRARVFDVEVEASPGNVAVSAAHDGYLRLRGRVIHKRKWKLMDDSLVIEDSITGHGERDVRLALHDHPDFAVSMEHAGLVIIRNGDGLATAQVSVDSRFDTGIASYNYHPEFGVSLPAQKIASRWRGELPVRFVTKVAWTTDPAGAYS
jgi:uncharacterized heparinase superfamily protein